MKTITPTFHFRSYSRIIGICIICLMTSCVTSKKITYLQELAESDFEIEGVTPGSYRIQPSDNLFIRVTTPDPRWSAMFNTLPVTSATMSVGEQAVDLLSYAVRQDGLVEIPYLGLIPVEGKTLTEVKEALVIALADYVTDAAITVKLVNNYVSILGEVMRPGRYLIYKEQMNIFEALSMAGDLGDFGDRSKAQLVRKTTEGTIVNEFNLTDGKIIFSEYFHVMPNDVIYIQPIKGRFFQMNQFPYALILSSITTFLLLMNYFQ